MPDIKTITTVNGTVYNLVDAGARELISELQEYTEYLGVTTTPLTDGASTNPIVINGEDVVAKKGNIANYGSKEFIYNGSVWQEFGDLSGLGDLAYKNSASGSYTPAGSISTPTFTGTSGTVNVTGNIGSGDVEIEVGSGTANYTPAGTVSAPNVSVVLDTDTVANVTGVGTLPNLTMTVADENLTFEFNAGTLPTLGTAKTVATGVQSATASAPTFSGTGVELVGTIENGTVSASGSFTPEGSVSQPTFSGTGATIEVE